MKTTVPEAVSVVEDIQKPSLTCTVLTIGKVILSKKTQAAKTWGS